MAIFHYLILGQPPKTGWGGRIRTPECGRQRPVSYRLTTPQFVNCHGSSVICKNDCLLIKITYTIFLPLKISQIGEKYGLIASVILP